MTKESAENRQAIRKKIYIPPKPPQKKIEAARSNKLTGGENSTAPPPPKKTSDDPKIVTENFNAPTSDAVNPQGHPLPAPAALIAPGQKVAIYFSTDSTGLTNDALATLKAIVDYFLKHPDDQIIIEGYGDSNKNYRHNQRLSQLRANVVKSYLVRKGIAKARIKAFWMGSENPVSSDDSLEDRAATHQVQVKFEPN